MDFSDRTAIITGGAGGFGNSFAEALAAAGCKVVLADVEQEKVERNARAINKAGGQAVGFVCDVTQARDVDALIAKTLDTFGALDILINNAGGSLGVPKVPIDEIREEDWDRVMDVNLKGTFLCTRAATGPMKAARYGKIVNLSSITARVGGQLTPVQYVSAKGAIISFTRHVAQELGPYGINVNAVAPGIVLTERLQKMWYGRKTEREREEYLNRIPLRRLATPTEITRVVLFLCSDEASFITGVTLDVNGGLFSV